MRKCGENGLTLMELLITVTILLIIASVATPLLSGSLDAHRSGIARSRLYQEGLILMERMTSEVRRCTVLLIPNNHKPARAILSFSGFINEDNDYYFGDSRFPRIDEDFNSDMDKNDKSGIKSVDDDGDGFTDEGGIDNDDEDASTDEEIFDGMDNDLDGNIDEDLKQDANQDGKPGIAGMDDDGDTFIDEGDITDDDEDGQKQEDVLNPMIYTYNSATATLTRSIPYTSSSVILSTRVTSFQATYEAPDATRGPRVQIALTLTGDDGKSIQFFEYVYPRNLLQKTGKRVK